MHKICVNSVSHRSKDFYVVGLFLLQITRARYLVVVALKMKLMRFNGTFSCCSIYGCTWDRDCALKDHAELRTRNDTLVKTAYCTVEVGTTSTIHKCHHADW
jgi:hypothetical protein